MNEVEDVLEGVFYAVDFVVVDGDECVENRVFQDKGHAHFKKIVCREEAERVGYTDDPVIAVEEDPDGVQVPGRVLDTSGNEELLIGQLYRCAVVDG